MLEGAYLSQPVITFHNRVFTLAPTAVHTMKDLQTLRVSAFQRARQILGTTFSDIVDQNPRYEEVARQEGQVAAPARAHRCRDPGTAGVLLLSGSVARG